MGWQAPVPGSRNNAEQKGLYALLSVYHPTRIALPFPLLQGIIRA